MVFCTEFLGRWWSQGNIRTAYTTYAAAIKTTTLQKTRCRDPYAETQHLIFLMMGVFNRNMSNKEYINKITLSLQFGISKYFTYHHCHSNTSSYQTQHYSFSNDKNQHKCIALDIMPKKRCLFHTVFFALGYMVTTIMC